MGIETKKFRFIAVGILFLAGLGMTAWADERADAIADLRANAAGLRSMADKLELSRESRIEFNRTGSLGDEAEDIRYRSGLDTNFPSVELARWIATDEPHTLSELTTLLRSCAESLERIYTQEWSESEPTIISEPDLMRLAHFHQEVETHLTLFHRQLMVESLRRLRTFQNRESLRGLARHIRSSLATRPTGESLANGLSVPDIAGLYEGLEAFASQQQIGSRDLIRSYHLFRSAIESLEGADSPEDYRLRENLLELRDGIELGVSLQDYDRASAETPLTHAVTSMHRRIQGPLRPRLDRIDNISNFLAQEMIARFRRFDRVTVAHLRFMFRDLIHPEVADIYTEHAKSLIETLRARRNLHWNTSSIQSTMKVFLRQCLREAARPR